MATVFYDHLIAWDQLQAYVESLDLSRQERDELLEHIEELVHTETLATILTHLPQEHHDEFLTLFHQAPYDDTHLGYLQSRTQADIPYHIQTRTLEIITLVTSTPPQGLWSKVRSLFGR